MNDVLYSVVHLMKWWDLIRTFLAFSFHVLHSYLTVILIFSCFQTSLLLTALPLRCIITTCCFRVAALSGHSAFALSHSSMAPELIRIQLSVDCCCGKSGLLICWQEAACCFVFLCGKLCLPVVQISPSK